jgi:hypothetical protein
MLEIVALIFLTRQIGRIAESKGLKPGTWKLFTVLAWIAGEIAGVVVGLLIFGPDNIFSILLVAIAGAVTGYFLIKANLSKRPDVTDEIDQIGNNQY